MYRVRDRTDTEVAKRDADLDVLLKQHFGYNCFRPMQREIISDTLGGHDAFVLMPTGGGKSLCFQLPSLILPGVTVVISPLIALMQDQVKALEANGVRATFLNSSLDYSRIVEREAQAASGHFDLLYLAPERLMSSAGQNLLRRIRVAHFAIDEAHCISEWGHDFRPEYRMLGRLRTQFPQVPITALTATATPRVAEDIIGQLHLRDPEIYRGRFERENLFYEVRPKQRTFEQVAAYLNQNPDADGIIYCHSRASTDRMAEKLRERGIAALPYHAGLENNVRADNQHQFVYGDTRVIAATIAFGMGINKLDVRFVIHTDLPRSLEAYYQETGRAGRDGLPADCILFFSHGDRAKIERFIEEKEDEREKAQALSQLQQMIEFAYATGCRCHTLLSYFGETRDGNCHHCDNCRLPPDLSDATEDARKLLSAVARTDQRFGLNYVIDVLRGADNERIVRNRHDQLTVYGIGRDRPKPYWRRLAEALFNEDQLAQTRDEFPTTFLTDRSMPVLRGDTQVSVVVPRAARRPDRPASRRRAEGPEGPVDAALFETLRRLRRELATEQGVPPYVIFSDASLRQMAQVHPRTAAQFLTITGVGQYKLDRYGGIFMNAIGGEEGEGREKREERGERREEG